MTCDVSQCDRPAEKRGWCNRHYLRWHRHGSPTAGGRERIIGDDERRFWSYVDQRSGDECWEWTGGKTPTGYGTFHSAALGVRQNAQRWAFYFSNGQRWPDGLDVDHLCRNRACCNPAHLEAVTHVENVKRRWRWERGEW